MLRNKVGRKATALTDKRKKHLTNLLKDFYAENIILVVEYLKNSNDNYAKFMRGETGQKDYTGFDNVFRSTKMNDKIDRAILWERNVKSSSVYNDNGLFMPFILE